MWRNKQENMEHISQCGKILVEVSTETEPVPASNAHTNFM